MSGVLDTFRLDGRTAIVTGGYKGIGRALTQGLAEAGADVVIGGRDGDACDRVAAEIGAATGRSVTGMRLDVTDPASCADGLAATLSATGRCDILVNNAGCASTGRRWRSRSRSGVPSSTSTSTGCGS